MHLLRNTTRAATQHADALRSPSRSNVQDNSPCPSLVPIFLALQGTSLLPPGPDVREVRGCFAGGPCVSQITGAVCLTRTGTSVNRTSFGALVVRHARFHLPRCEHLLTRAFLLRPLEPCCGCETHMRGVGPQPVLRDSGDGPDKERPASLRRLAGR